MRINTIKIDKIHWTTDYIPISYINMLSEKQLNKSLTFLWCESNTYYLNAICRAYYIDKNTIEIGDLWLDKKFHGKVTENGEKVSILFMKRVINKIWQNYPNVKQITLSVHNDNIPAIKLYEKLHFKILGPITIKQFHMINGYKMYKNKKIYRQDPF